MSQKYRDRILSAAYTLMDKNIVTPPRIHGDMDFLAVVDEVIDEIVEKADVRFAPGSWVQASDGRYGWIVTGRPSLEVQMADGNATYVDQKDVTPHVHDFVGPLARPYLAACVCGVTATERDFVWGVKSK